MTNQDKIEALEAAILLVEEALELVLPIANVDANFDAYVYRQISEHLNNQNPYNQSLGSMLAKLCEEENETD